jgi:Uma2 family endonuclease
VTVLVTEAYTQAMSTETITKKLFTVDEFCRMLQAGILTYDTRYELIRGKIIENPRPRGPHVGLVKRLSHLFTSKLGRAVIVSVQESLFLDSYSMPFIDLAISNTRPNIYTDGDPFPGEVVLAIEVADASVWYDTTVKVGLYAESRIPEYWLVDIHKDVVVVRTEPVGKDYRKVEVRKRGEVIEPCGFPGAGFAVDEILGATDVS